MSRGYRQTKYGNPKLLCVQPVEGQVALKQKLNSIAVKCKDELHAPQEIMALVSNTVLPQNEQQRCYLECVYKNLNLIKNNRFNAADGKTLAQIRFANQPEEHKKAVIIIENCAKEGRDVVVCNRNWKFFLFSCKF